VNSAGEGKGRQPAAATSGKFALIC
jgi:hypothetical protein